jgi:hypothetical protein
VGKTGDEVTDPKMMNQVKKSGWKIAQAAKVYVPLACAWQYRANFAGFL